MWILWPGVLPLITLALLFQASTDWPNHCLCELLEKNRQLETHPLPSASSCRSSSGGLASLQTLGPPPVLSVFSWRAPLITHFSSRRSNLCFMSRFCSCVHSCRVSLWCWLVAEFICAKVQRLEMPTWIFIQIWWKQEIDPHKREHYGTFWSFFISGLHLDLDSEVYYQLRVTQSLPKYLPFYRLLKGEISRWWAIPWNQIETEDGKMIPSPPHHWLEVYFFKAHIHTHTHTQRHTHTQQETNCEWNKRLEKNFPN